MNRILIQFAHPAFERSTVNRALVAAASNLNGVEINDLYEHYPDFAIDVEREQKLLLEADLIVWQFPTMWYSVPPLMRQWQDDVLQCKFAYGKNNQLSGKALLVSTTTGGSRHDYKKPALHGAPVNDYLAAMRQTARFCQLHYLSPQIVYGASSYENREDVEPIAEDYARLLLALRECDGDWERLAKIEDLTAEEVQSHG